MGEHAQHKRRLLGPELASKLTAKAWSVTPDLDHPKLSKKNGCKYLLKFLQERLRRAAVPDAEARLEDLLIRLRMTSTSSRMSMSQWANEVMEAHRKVQRAMIRARQIQRSKEKTEGKNEPEPQREPSSMPTSPKSPSWTSPLSPTRSSRPSPMRTIAGYGTDPIAGIQESGDESGDFAAVPQQELEADGDGEEWWSAEDWRR